MNLYIYLKKDSIDCIAHYVDSDEKNGAPEMLLDLTIFLTNILHFISSFLFCFLRFCLKLLRKHQKDKSI